MDKKRGSFTSRDLALVAGLTGLYLVYGYASGVSFGHTILELDLFFLISTVFTVVVSVKGKTVERYPSRHDQRPHTSRRTQRANRNHDFLNP